MAITHTIEYSKSSKATCCGPAPCKGSNIVLGSLRYGQTTPGKYGDSVEWRHWGCVTPEILRQLAIQLDSVRGLYNLRVEDQQKILKAVDSGHVDPSDIPDTAKSDDVTQSTTSQKKRKNVDMTATSLSHSSASQQGRPVTEPQEVEEQVVDDNEPEEESKDELYCQMSAKIVGLQYYNGLVGPGEQVRLIREPHNQYDRNAIMVQNIGRTQVGHIPRTVASSLAPLLDRNLVTVEGTMLEGNITVQRSKPFSLAMTLKIFGASDKRSELERLLIWATPRQRGFPPRNNSGTTYAVPGAPADSGRGSGSMPAAGSSQRSIQRRSGMTAAQIKQAAKQQEALQKAVQLNQMLNNLEKVDDEGRRSSLLDTLCSTDDVLNLPLHPDPPGIKNGDLVVDLLKHQSQALQWCIEHEYPDLPKAESDKPVQFWQLRKNGTKAYYYNIATNTPQESPPPLGRGALCADSMGLGKTLTMLALILATKKDVPAGFSKSTLIVVPLSVLSNWEKQIEEHCIRGAVSSCVYYGTSRSLTPQDLMNFDVIITTYQTVAGEHIDAGAIKSGSEGSSRKKKKIERSLFAVQWKRIILDEGHQIRNSKTKMAKAVCALSAQRRWVLTGTPIINSPSDLGSVMKFLQICKPLDNEDMYKRLLLRPLKDGDPAGAELLRALMSHICIRRTKEMQDSNGVHLVPLPPVEMTLVPVALTDEARKLYDAVEQVSKQRVESLMNNSGGVMVQSNVLSMLTRLRQLALHPGLVPSNYLEQLQVDGESDVAAITISPQDKIRLQGLLARAVEDNEECPVCFDILTEPRITGCAHLFCLDCISEVISRDAKCPMDRRPITIGELIAPLPPTELTQAPIPQEEDAGFQAGSSAKIDQLVHLLKLSPSTEKSLVFSQFTSFLDKIAETLEEQGIPYVQFDGRMSAKRRQEALERFSIPLQEDSGCGLSGVIPPPPKHTRRVRTGDDTDVSFIDDDASADFVMDNSQSDDDYLDDTADKDFSSKKVKGKGKGKVKVNNRNKPHNSFVGYENPKVMLISLKAGALGLNLTVANNVYLMDPWWQEGIESQAIDRCNRIGQKKPVHVYQLIADNTVESKVIEIQEKKKLLIQHAFSGIKRTETQRQKKEARLQDLIELFGIRQQAATA